MEHDDDFFDGGYDDDIYVDPPADGDAVEHLWNAAHELLRAVRTLVDAADEFVESQRHAMSRRVPPEAPPEPASRVRRIDIDGREDDPDEPGDRWSGTPGTSGAAPR
jgi:hypothetical protein